MRSISQVTTETKIKTTMRCHFALARMAIKSKQTKNKKCWQGWRKTGTLTHSGDIVNGATAMKNNIAVTGRRKRRIAIWLSNSTPRCTPLKSKRALRAVHVVAHSQKHYPQQPEGRNNPNAHWQNVVHRHNTTVLSLKKGQQRRTQTVPSEKETKHKRHIHTVWFQLREI